MCDMPPLANPFLDLVSLGDAARMWGKDESTLRKAISDGRLLVGRDCKKFGKQWVLRFSSMCSVFGGPKNA